CGFVLSKTESVPLSSAYYEIFSAFGTVGITVGITCSLSLFGRALIICLMFFGRIGITSVMYAILVRTNRERVDIGYPILVLPIG
ncbi:MAG: Trk family potassium uptake protein, partial [Clostridia bacterium]|nr:Trk family potassium uptake protein [Clostridia bacterium]